MNQYTIYCTPEQTKNALELGAPIYTTNEHLFRHPHEWKYWVEVDIQGNFYAAKIPTAEQMIGWLEEQRVLIEIYYNSTYRHYNYCKKYGGRGNWGRALHDSYTQGFPSRKEATLAAIDEVLKYLKNLKINEENNI